MKHYVAIVALYHGEFIKAAAYIHSTCKHIIHTEVCVTTLRLEHATFFFYCANTLVRTKICLARS